MSTEYCTPNVIFIECTVGQAPRSAWGEKNRQSPDRRNDIAILQHFDTLNLLGTGRPKEAVGKGGEREEE